MLRIYIHRKKLIINVKENRGKRKGDEEDIVKKM